MMAFGHYSKAQNVEISSWPNFWNLRPETAELSELLYLPCSFVLERETDREREKAKSINSNGLDDIVWSHVLAVASSRWKELELRGEFQPAAKY